MRHNCRSRVIRPALALAVVAALMLLSMSVGAVDDVTSSGQDTNYFYARIVTAKVPNGLNKSLDELQDIAREHGTEEVIQFPVGANPEAYVQRWVVRLGTPEYSYPGFTMEARSRLEKVTAANQLKWSPDGKSAVEILPPANAKIQWTLPDSALDPLQCVVSLDDEIFTVNTVYETRSLSKSAQWPRVIRIDAPNKNGVIIQLFDYLDEMPQRLEVLAEGMIEDSVVEVEETGAEGVHREQLVFDKANTSCTVSFSDSLPGFSLSWAPEWVPAGSPLQLHINAIVGADLSSWLSGTFCLTRYSATDGSLMLGTASGNLTIDIGAELQLRAGVDVWLLPRFEFDLPFVPGFDLRAYDLQDFDTYLLDSNVSVSDGTDRLVLVELGYWDITKAIEIALTGGADPGLLGTVLSMLADAGVAVEAEIWQSADMTCDLIWTSEGSSFTNEGQCCTVQLDEGGYSGSVYYNENLTLTGTAVFYPTFFMKLLFYRWAPPFGHLPWDFVSGRQPLGFASSSLEFAQFDPACPFGDVDCSSSVDAVDIQLVINNVLRIGTVYSCDVNGDGSTDAIDVQLVINDVLGINLP